jgi:hypothetical protein
MTLSGHDRDRFTGALRRESVTIMGSAAAVAVAR